MLKMKGFCISVGKYTTMIDSAIQNTQFFTFFLMLNYVAQCDYTSLYPMRNRQQKTIFIDNIYNLINKICLFVSNTYTNFAV